MLLYSNLHSPHLEKYKNKRKSVGEVIVVRVLEQVICNLPPTEYSSTIPQKVPCYTLCNIFHISIFWTCVSCDKNLFLRILYVQLSLELYVKIKLQAHQYISFRLAKTCFNSCHLFLMLKSIKHLA